MRINHIKLYFLLSKQLKALETIKDMNTNDKWAWWGRKELVLRRIRTEGLSEEPQEIWTVILRPVVLVDEALRIPR